MKLKKYRLVISLICVFVISINVQALTKDKLTNPKADFLKTKITVYTADSLASGNYKDVLSSFFQLGLNNLTGTNKEFKFTSNFFAIALKCNKNLAVDTNYVKYTPIRRFNFNINSKLDSTNKFKNFAVGIKYAIIDKRDITVSKVFVNQVLYQNKDFIILERKCHEKTNKLQNEYPHFAEKFQDQSEEFFTDSTFKFTFKQLDKQVKDTLVSIARENKLKTILSYLTDSANISAAKFMKTSFQDVYNTFQKKPLWTIGANYATNSKINFETEFLQGLGKIETGVARFELDFKVDLDIYDTTINLAKTQRDVLNGSFGINWIIANNRKGQPLIEFKVAGSYKNTIAGLYPKEVNNNLTVDGTIRFRIIGDVWVPININYDPKTGKVLGFLNITTNFF